LFVDASGNVGVGTSSVNALLEVNNSTAGGEVQRIEGNYSGSGSVILTNWRRAGGSVAAALKYNDDSSPLCMSIGTTTSHEFRIRTADTDAITIDASQRVGIGTSSPNVPLDIESSAGTAVKIRLASNTSNRALAFSNAAETIGWTVGNGVIASARQFVVYDNEAGAARLLIDSSGNVGIGTTTVSDKLHVADGNITFSYADGSTGLRNKISWRTESPFFDETAYIAVDRTGVSGAPADIVLATGGAGTATEKARITSAGLVGIGTSTPSVNLQINAASDVGIALSNSSSVTSGNRGGISMYNSDISTVGNIRFVAVTDNVGTEIQFYTRPAAGSLTQSMTLDSTGRLGIGTTSPTEKLHVDGNAILKATNSYIGLQNASGTSTGYIQGQSSFLAIAGGSGSSNTIAFYPASTETMRIDSSGRLLVGTSTSLSSPYWSNLAKLQVTGEYGAGHFASFQAGASGAGLIFQKSRSATVGGNTIVNSGDNLMDIAIEGNDGTGFVRAAAIQCVVDGTPGANDMPGRLVFSTTADGASSPTERLRITSAGLVGIGTTSPVTASAGYNGLTVNGSTGGTIYLQGGGTSSGRLVATSTDFYIGTVQAGGNLIFQHQDGSYERARIDSSGRLLVGTSTARTNYFPTTEALTPNVQLEASRGGLAILGTGNGSDLFIGKGSSVTAADDFLGEICFTGFDGTNNRTAARILCQTDAACGAGDMPGRLVFSTTADGASSPTERMRITSAGNVGIGTTSPSSLLELSGAMQPASTPAAGS
jgi:hypothetical protein